MFKEYQRLDKPFQDWDKFFDEYAGGKRQNKGINSLYRGSSNDLTLFWLEEEEYPFAFVYPVCMPTLEHELGYYFYVRQIN